MEFIFLFISIFKIVCYFNIFNKCGDRGWKAIIPLLDIWTRFKLFYKKKLFIIYLVVFLALVASLFMFAVCSVELLNYYDGDPYSVAWMSNIPEQLMNSTTIFFFMLMICSLILFIFETLLNYHMAKSFNKGMGFFIGLILLNIVFVAILAFFNENQYIGNLKEKNQQVLY